MFLSMRINTYELDARSGMIGKYFSRLAKLQAWLAKPSARLVSNEPILPVIFDDRQVVYSRQFG